MKIISLLFIFYHVIYAEISEQNKVLVNKDLIGTQCKSRIYCQGELLEKVQLAGIFSDSKTFVDMPTSKPSKEVLEEFGKIKHSKDKEGIKMFVEKNFLQAGLDVRPIRPLDWKSAPKFLSSIGDPSLKDFGTAVHLKWKSLVRKFEKNISCPLCESSRIDTAYPFVVPGGRFREFYYWDTFWIVEGLLVSEMQQTAKGMILNMLDSVKQFGFIPNGFRIYYLNRSQPPLLIQIVKKYFESTNDLDLLHFSLPLLEIEYKFWMDFKSVTLNDNSAPHRLNVYRAYNSEPRPESYAEDYYAAREISESTNDHERFYLNIATGAESGWDFSSRWLTDKSSISTIDIIDVIPVELNSIMYENEVILSELLLIANETLKAAEYKEASKLRMTSMQRFLWDSETCGWFDYNITSKTKRDDSYHLSNISPLWTGAYHSSLIKSGFIGQLLNSLDSPLNSFSGGVPTSLVNSSQQWDFPNVWAPYQYYLEIMYEKLIEREGINYSRQKQSIVERFIASTYCGWKRTGHLFEKYDATSVGYSGNGGEYKVQEGFGWTNGVVLYFLNKYGSTLKVPECTHEENLISKVVKEQQISGLYLPYFVATGGILVMLLLFKKLK